MQLLLRVYVGAIAQRQCVSVIQERFFTATLSAAEERVGTFTLDDDNPKTLADVSRRFFALRRMLWRLHLGGIGIFAVLITCLGVFDQERYPGLVEVLCLTLGAAFVLCCLGFVVVWHSLTHFLCPRCGKRFILAWWSSWPTSACKHCGLKLG